MNEKTVKRAAILAVGLLLAVAAYADGLPYDSRVEYLEAPRGTNNRVSYIDTGIYPYADVGALVRAMPLHATDDMTVFGARSDNNAAHIWKWWAGFIYGNRGYLTRGTANPANDFQHRFSYSANKAYDIYLNYRNDRDRRIVEVDGTYAFNLPIPETDEYPADEYVTDSVYLFGNNQGGTTASTFSGNVGYARIYSAKFTKGDETIMDLVPVRKDGVGYFYDKVGKKLLGKTGTSTTPAFTYGADIHAVSGSVKLGADADWSNDGTVWLDDDAVLDLDGHTLTVAKVAGTGKITDTSAGEPGTLRFTVADNAENPGSVSVTGNLKVKTTLELPYDAQVEYLEAPKNTANKVSYIDTGFYPGDNAGALVRVMPFDTSDDHTICGMRSDYDGTQWRWYMGFNGGTNGGTSGYLTWGTSNPGKRFSYSANKQYDIYLNYMNDRNRKVVAKTEEREPFNLAINDTWPDAAATNTVYLFGLNQNGTTGSAFSGNDGYSRIYSAKFTRDATTAMNLVPVRKNGVGYFYDKVGGKLLGKTGTDATPDFVYGADIDATVSGSIRLDSDADWTGLGRVLADDATIDLNGHTLTVAAVSGAGAVTNSSPTSSGTLRFVVNAGTNVVSSLALTGNLKVEKLGPGTLSLDRSGQTFTGGVLVAGGTAAAVSGYNEADNYWGPSNGVITVAADATFDVMGNRGFCTKRFMLSGGTLDNNAVMSSDLTDGIGNVTLTEDSYLKNKARQCGTTFSPVAGETSQVDLRGNTWTVDIGLAGHLYLKVPVVDGTLDIVNGGYLYIPAGATGGSDSVNLRMVGAAFNLVGDFSVRDYYAGYTGGYNHGAGRLHVYGTFTPAAQSNGKDLFHGCLMMNGSTIDLSAKTAPFNVVAQGYAGTGNTDGNRTVSFDDNATVTLLLGNRTVSSRSPLIDWSGAVPENYAGLTFTGVFADGKTRRLECREGGVYPAPTGLIISFR